jgi:hypothetical protein
MESTNDMSNHFFWTITLIISSFLFGCTTAMELDTNGYTTKFGKESEKYCPNKTSENITTFIPCSEIKHDQSI